MFLQNYETAAILHCRKYERGPENSKNGLIVTIRLEEENVEKIAICRSV